jgi:protein-tyrosine phosphatase
MHIQHILVVCVGNICRSPMAEYLLKREFPHLHIHSSGIKGLTGHPADEKALLCMLRLNIDMDTHVAKKLDSQMLKAADLVLVMSQSQQRHIEHTWPFAKGKTFRLGHWRQCDVADPYQHEQAIFDQTCQLIQACITDWKNYI